MTKHRKNYGGGHLGRSPGDLHKSVTTIRATRKAVA